MTRSRLLTLAFGLALTAAATIAQEQPQPFLHPDRTTHWYQVVPVREGIDWSTAHRRAAESGGHLATITSAAENAFIAGLCSAANLWVQSGAGMAGPWIGGVQANLVGSGAQRWNWVELEDFSFSAFAPNQPVASPSEDRLHLRSEDQNPGSHWANGSASKLLPGYVVEYAGARVPQTVGLRQHDARSMPGYTLFNPWRSRDTFLIDPRGRVVRRWTSQFYPGMSAYLLPNGHLIRAGKVDHALFTNGGAGGIVEEFDWSGKLVWSYRHATATEIAHHDFAVLPNGNILMIVWELIGKEECLANGRDPQLLSDAMLWPLKVVEVKPDRQHGGGAVVWQWRAWDHLVQDFDPSKKNHGDPATQQQLINLNYTYNDWADWLHANAIDYNPKLDQIMLSVHHFSEIWIIDHSTTTAEAAGHSGGRSGRGGDLLYRWGNQTTMGPGGLQSLFVQHDAQWIAEGLPGAGNVLIFNNGGGRPGGDYSTVDEIALPVPDAHGNYPKTQGFWGPHNPSWTYQAAKRTDFYSSFVSGCQRLRNGNTLICAGAQGYSFEVTPGKQTVWEYRNPVGALGVAVQGSEPYQNVLFRSPRYEADGPELSGLTLTPGPSIERLVRGLRVEGSRLPYRASLGTTARLSFRSAGGRAWRRYQMLCSTTPGLTPVDGRHAAIGLDPLVEVSLLGQAPSVFANFSGYLSGAGLGEAQVHVPPIPALAGLDLHVVALELDPTVPTGIAEISNTVNIQLVR